MCFIRIHPAMEPGDSDAKMYRDATQRREGKIPRLDADRNTLIERLANHFYHPGSESIAQPRTITIVEVISSES